MMRAGMVGFALLLGLGLALAQDFQKSYDLPPGGQIQIDSFMGDVKVLGYGGKSIEVKAHKRGSDGDPVQVADLSSGNRIELVARPPRMRREAAPVDFEVRVPSTVPFNFDRLSSFGGSILVTNVVGRLRADSVRGSVEVKDVRGLVSASSVSGNVNVEIGRGQEDKNIMRFRSISGDVVVSAPSNLDALIAMSSDSGMLRTDFPIDVQERRYGPGREARGKLGSGKLMLWINSNSGRVSLLQRPERQPS